MPRFRCLFLGILILLGLVAGSEYALRYHFDLAAPQIGLNTHNYGWTACSDNFLTPPQNQTVSYAAKPGVAIDLHFGSHGFRRSQTASQSSAPEIICLGDELVLAPEIKHQQTFVSLWDQLAYSTADAGNQESIRNGGMPQGCPLLLQIQFDARIASTQPRRVVCFISRKSLANDFHIRRSVVFDELGQIVACQHPGIEKTTETNTETSPKNRLEEFALFRVGFPLICRLFLNESAENDPLRSSAPTTMKSNGSKEFTQLSLTPLVKIAQRCREMNTEFMVIYLPDQSEVMSDGGDFTNGKISTDTRRIASDYLQGAGLPFIDLTSLLKSESDPEKLYLKQSGHFSVYGHQIVADLLSRSFGNAVATGNTTGSVVK